MGLYRAISVDMDGCFFNKAYLASEKPDVIEANRSLLDEFSRAGEEYNGTTVFLDSNRQSIGDDNDNAASNETGSSYPCLLKIGDYLKADVDTFLLPDLYNDLEDGTTFAHALTLLDEASFDYDPDKFRKADRKEWLHDHSKLTILYAQIHKFACEHPSDTIDFYFFDDREVLLAGLHDYFSNNRLMLPDNVTLHVCGYQGPGAEPLVTYYKPITGLGQIDKDYKNSVKKIAAISIESPKCQEFGLSSTRSGRCVRTYEDAQEAGFLLTSPIDCVRDYHLGPPPAIEKKSERPGSSERSASQSSGLSLFKHALPKKWPSFPSLTSLPSPRRSKKNSTRKFETEEDFTITSEIDLMVESKEKRSSSDSVSIATSASLFAPVPWKKASVRSRQASEEKELEAGSYRHNNNPHGT
ncbi:hypothetical protein [Legionella spiritensis]|uniref:Dot/Icm T4SS effector n=1 Tax=Legionella spiritensis TaxID=452 RepID=A0A0W0Z3G5_LEGSP|nr:hypothetical protein [Legionella spiritensis]KTD63347.1 Dot/Icm T4SS effector [Legionella spiritensis]SNV35456.1 Dot/Icm secretion system substrate [Legionella spiritensis]